MRDSAASNSFADFCEILIVEGTDFGFAVRTRLRDGELVRTLRIDIALIWDSDSTAEFRY